MNRSLPPFRTGFGYDIHRLVSGRPLVLGGVTIPSNLGLDGHSDADCLVHAVADALLGSVADGDIGLHFPNTDPSIRGIDSLEILRFCAERVRVRGYRVANVDAMVVAEQPKLAPWIPAMRAALAAAVGLAVDAMSIKATTNERIGGLGAGEGIAAYANCLVWSG